MSEQGNVEIVREVYAAFGRRDVAALLRLVDPEPEWEYAGPREIPWAGSFMGHDGVKRFVAAIDDEAEIRVMETRDYVAQGDQVVVLGYEKLRSKRTGRTYEGHFAHAFTLAGGKIIRFRDYTDTAAVAAAFRDGSVG